MQFRGSISEFLASPQGQSTKWYIDPATSELVTFCDCCQAEARHTVNSGEFTFSHEPWCVCIDGVTSELKVH
jgi:hypothetical protein